MTPDRVPPSPTTTRTQSTTAPKIRTTTTNPQPNPDPDHTRTARTTTKRSHDMTTRPGSPERDKPLCGGRRRGGREGTCERPAGWGTDHAGVGACKLHGGATPNHAIAAQRVLATEAVRTYGARVDLPPSEALLEEFGWAVGHVRWLRGIVQQLDPDALVWGKTEEVDKRATEFPGVDAKHLAAPNVWLELYHRERRLMLDLGKTIDGLKLEARRVELAEAQGAQLASVIQAFVSRLGLSAEQAALVPGALREAIGALSAVPADGAAR